MVCWWGWEVNSLTFDRPRVSVQNFSFLACLEVAEKFVVGGGWVVEVVVVCKPILVFSLCLSQAEQKLSSQIDSWNFIETQLKQLCIKFSKH